MVEELFGFFGTLKDATHLCTATQHTSVTLSELKPFD